MKKILIFLAFLFILQGCSTNSKIEGKQGFVKSSKESDAKIKKEAIKINTICKNRAKIAKEKGGDFNLVYKKCVDYAIGLVE